MKFFGFFCTLLAFSCSRINNTPAEHSFYYWKTTFPANSTSAHFISKQNIDHFYIRYFDVDWSSEHWSPVPRAEIDGIANSAPFTSNFTPVIFITNNTFKEISHYWIDSLAYKIRNKIIFINNRITENRTSKGVEQAPADTIREIQIDCDWTAGTRENYFKFLRKFKTLFPGKIISATIRLYPYKYPDLVGVPPVDRGLLMCYNITDVKSEGNQNSIFTLKDLKQYLVPKKYPLPLDVGLPVFGWYAWFSHDRYKGIIYPGNIDTAILQRSGNDYTVLSDTTIGHFLQRGDKLRLEYPDPADLEKAYDQLHNFIPGIKRITFFHYDRELITRYEKNIQNIYNRR